MASIKIASVLLKSLCKPIANELKERSQHAGKLRRFFDRLGQVNHRITTKIQARAKNLKLSKVKPLVEDESVKLGAEFFSEFLVIFVGISGIAAELTRKYFSDKAAAEEQKRVLQELQEAKEKRAVEKEKSLRERLLKLESTLLEMENSKIELLHDKIVQDQLHHLELTEQALSRIEAIEKHLGIVSEFDTDDVDNLENDMTTHETTSTDQVIKDLTSIRKLVPVSNTTKAKLIAARPGALPHLITSIGENLIAEEAAQIADPKFADTFLSTDYAAQEARVKAAMESNKLARATEASQDPNAQPVARKILHKMTDALNRTVDQEHGAQSSDLIGEKEDGQVHSDVALASQSSSHGSDLGVVADAGTGTGVGVSVGTGMGSGLSLYSPSSSGTSPEIEALRATQKKVHAIATAALEKAYQSVGHSIANCDSRHISSVVEHDRDVTHDHHHPSNHDSKPSSSPSSPASSPASSLTLSDASISTSINQTMKENPNGVIFLVPFNAVPLYVQKIASTGPNSGNQTPVQSITSRYSATGLDPVRLSHFDPNHDNLRHINSQISVSNQLSPNEKKIVQNVNQPREMSSLSSSSSSLE